MTTKRFFHAVLLACSAAIALANVGAAAPMVSDPNLLSGLAANPANIGISTYFNDGGASSVYGPGGADYGPQNATNGTGGGPGADFVFAQGDPDERLAVTGFNSALGFVRVWTATDLAPSHITIYSSTSSQTSITASNYSPLVATTTPVWTAGTGASAGLEYVTFDVSAPVGTQSLLFDFGATNSGNPQIPGFVRIAEVQALPTPEPASFVLGGLGAIGLLVAARRHRKG